MRRIFALIAAAGACAAQPKEPCYAFLLKGDITAVCQSQTTQITHRGNIQNFAVSDDLASMAYVSGGAGAATVISLKTGASKHVESVDELVASCGGILPVPVGASASTRDIVTGAELTFPPYFRFRCSADRKTVAGMVKHDLYEGTPPPTSLRRRATFTTSISISARMEARPPGSTTSSRFALRRIPPLRSAWSTRP